MQPLSPVPFSTWRGEPWDEAIHTPLGTYPGLDERDSNSHPLNDVSDVDVKLLHSWHSRSLHFCHRLWLDLSQATKLRVSIGCSYIQTQHHPSHLTQLRGHVEAVLV